MKDQIAAEPGYRWVIVMSSALMLAIGMGLLVNGLSVFFVPLHDAFGWQRGAVALINFSGLVGLALGGIVMGRIADVTTTRSVTLFGSIALGLCLLAAGQAWELWQFYTLFFVAGALGGGALFAPLVANVGNWFTRGAGLAVGIVSAGQALGQGAVPFGTSFLIGALGWQGAFTAMGLIALSTMVPLALMLRQPPGQAAARKAGFSAEDHVSPVPISTNVVVVWLSVAVLLCCACMAVPLMHLVPLVQDRGFTGEQASSVAMLMMMVAILGRIAFGKLADMIGAIPAYITAAAWQALLVFWFLQFHSLGNFYAYAVVYGFGYAGVMTGVLVTVRALTPPARRASSLGIVLVFAWLGHGLGGYQGGYFFDLTGNYTVTYANAAVVGLLNLVVVGALYLTIARRNAALAQPA